MTRGLAGRLDPRQGPFHGADVLKEPFGGGVALAPRLKRIENGLYFHTETKNTVWYRNFGANLGASWRDPKISHHQQNIVYRCLKLLNAFLNKRENSLINFFIWDLSNFRWTQICIWRVGEGKPQVPMSKCPDPNLKNLNQLQFLFMGLRKTSFLSGVIGGPKLQRAKASRGMGLGSGRSDVESATSCCFFRCSWRAPNEAHSDSNTTHLTSSFVAHSGKLNSENSNINKIFYTREKIGDFDFAFSALRCIAQKTLRVFWLDTQ